MPASQVIDPRNRGLPRPLFNSIPRHAQRKILNGEDLVGGPYQTSPVFKHLRRTIKGLKQRDIRA